jgi:pimeloyl-ACP methyl ester carboxylesterase
MKRVSKHFVPLCLMGVLLSIAVPARSSEAGGKQTALSSDGVEIAFTAEGKGKPALVFVHGWSCDRGYWRNQVAEFAKSHAVVTIDLAGHGESAANREEWTIGAFARDVAAVVETLGLEDVVLIGHSMGGAVNIEAAKLMPDRVAALVGVDTYQDLEGAVGEEEARQFMAGFKADFAGATRGFVRMMFPASADSTLVESVAVDLSSAPPAVAIASLEGALAYKWSRALAGVEVPVFAINSDLWPTSVEAGSRQARSFEVKLMPGRGHFVMLEDPEKFNALLAETIREISKKK